MCYEFGNWFLKARAKELQKAREKMDAPKEASPAPPVADTAPTRPPVKEEDKVPA